jgi:hypothetical protein
MNEYFVILNSPGIGFSPLIKSDDDTQMDIFNSKEEAIEAAESTHYGAACGYEIFKLGTGDSL